MKNEQLSTLATISGILTVAWPLGFGIIMWNGTFGDRPGPLVILFWLGPMGLFLWASIWAGIRAWPEAPDKTAAPAEPRISHAATQVGLTPYPRGDRHASTPEMEERRWINPSAVTKLAAVVAPDAPRPPGDPIDFVITLYRTTNPQMVAAFETAQPRPHIDAGYYHCAHIDRGSAKFSPEHLSDVLDTCRYDRSRHSAFLQPLTIARSSAPVPAAALLVTIYRSDSPNVAISALPPMPIEA